MRARLFVPALLLAAFVCSACGGGVPHATSADVLALHQPTPDATVDAVVRSLPQTLAGIRPTPTPTAVVVVVVAPVAPKPVVKSAPTAIPTAKPKPKAVAPTPTSTRH